MIRIGHLIAILWLAGNNLFAQLNYDSLLYVAEHSNERIDFFKIDSVLSLEAREFSTKTQKKLVFTCAAKTKKLNYEFIYANFIYRESIINTLHGELATAMRLAQEALLIYSKYPSFGSAQCYNTMGSMIAGQGDIETGLTYLEKALKIGDLFKGKPRYNRVSCDNHLVVGYINILDQNYTEAKKHLDEAYEKAKKTNYYSSECYVQLNYAAIYNREQKFDSVFIALNEAGRLANDHELHNHMCVVQERIAENYNAIGQPDSALYYYAIAEQIGIEQNLNRRLLTIYNKIIDIYTNREDYKQVAFYQERYITLFKSVKEKEEKERLEMAQTKFLVDEKIARIHSLALEKTHEQERNQLLQLAITVTIASFALLIAVIILFFNRYRLRKKIELERQEKALSVYQLMALKSQMNPHFVFNALNSIQDLILKNKTEESYTYITKFSHLVRDTLNHSNADFIDFEAELASINLYLDLERLRFKDDLTVEVETGNISNILIPPLLIQPFIENAFKHGLFHLEGRKHLSIRFQLDKVLYCTITDNGVGREKSAAIQQRRMKNHLSFATQSLQARFQLLQKLYGHQLGITYTDLNVDGKPTGTQVVLAIPFKQQF